MKSSVHNTKEIIWANSDVLWTNKLTCNFSDYDEWTLIESYQYWKGNKLYKWCNNRNRDRGRVWWDSRGSSEAVSREWFVHEAREM